MWRCDESVESWVVVGDERKGGDATGPSRYDQPVPLTSATHFDAYQLLLPFYLTRGDNVWLVE